MTTTPQNTVPQPPSSGTTHEVAAHGINVANAIAELEKLPVTLETAWKRISLEEQAAATWVTANQSRLHMAYVAVIVFALTLLGDHLLFVLIHG